MTKDQNPFTDEQSRSFLEPVYGGFSAANDVDENQPRNLADCMGLGGKIVEPQTELAPFSNSGKYIYRGFGKNPDASVETPAGLEIHPSLYSPRE